MTEDFANAAAARGYAPGSKPHGGETNVTGGASSTPNATSTELRTSTSSWGANPTAAAPFYPTANPKANANPPAHAPATPVDANDARPDAQRARHAGLMDEDEAAAAGAAPRGPPLPTLSQT